MRKLVYFIPLFSIALTYLLVRSNTEKSLSTNFEEVKSEKTISIKIKTNKKEQKLQAITKAPAKPNKNPETAIIKKYKQEDIKSKVLASFDRMYGDEISTSIELLGVKEFKGRSAKVARISHKKKSGVTSSYLALVDPNDGRVLKTWSRAIIEKFRKDPNEWSGFRLPAQN